MRVLPSLMLAGSVLPGRKISIVLYLLKVLCEFSLDGVSHGRVFLALVDKQEDRGTVVAQGGGKVEHLQK